MVSTAGPRVWVRFLAYHLDCEVDDLKLQLLLPVTKGEVFVFGKRPRPLHRTYAPKYFQAIYDDGTMPDGNYAVEPDIPGQKFNPYERVVQRFPISAPWRLSDLRSFLGLQRLEIYDSHDTLQRLLNDRDAMLVDAHSLSGWNEIDSRGLALAEATVLDALAACGTPDALGLMFALLHAAIWKDCPHSGREIAQRIHHCRKAAGAFLRSPVFARDAPDCNLKSRLGFMLESCIKMAERDGKRSNLRGTKILELPLPRRIFPVPRTREVQDAMRCLNAAGHHQWEELYSPLPDSFCPDGWEITKAHVQAAGAFLTQASLKLVESFQLGEAGLGRGASRRREGTRTKSQLH